MKNLTKKTIIFCYNSKTKRPKKIREQCFCYLFTRETDNSPRRNQKYQYAN